MTVADTIAYLQSKDPTLEVVIFDPWFHVYRPITKTATHPDKIELSPDEARFE